jgi:rubrerythrin
MTKDITNHDLYMCDECGNTTPIADDVCAVCGGKMSSLNGDDSRERDSLAENENGDSEESLESLREKEAEESDEDYHKSYQDDEDSSVE